MTPVNASELNQLLIECDYNESERTFLVEGFSEGFSLGFNAPINMKQTAPNLELTVGSETELWNKVMKEVKEGRYAGPFNKIPFDHYIQSPIGLVPKDGGTATRLIFHLSYPRLPKGELHQLSVNGNTPTELCSVEYPDVSDAIKICLVEGRNCSMGKSDMKSAFRHFPINPKFWCLLVMKARSPLDGKIYYFVDKCMPFGAAISCSHFQRFSNAIAKITEHKSGKTTINYLDDYFFAA